MSLSARHASHLAAFCLVVVLVGVGAFVVRSMMSARDAVSEAHRSSELSSAYDDARYRITAVQVRAEAYLRTPSPTGRAAFDAGVDEATASLDRLRAIGEPDDIAIVEAIYENDLPALETVRRIFLALERGLPITDEPPRADSVDRILAILEPRAEARRADASAKLLELVETQERDIRITLAVCAAGLVLVLVLVLAIQAFGKREAVHRSELDRMQKAALTDSLTGLGNHRAFVEELRRQVARASRHDEELALAVIDVDEFKEVNDTWGHARGDEVLVEVAALLRLYSREEDYAFRIGGDEFALILPHADGQTAVKAVERMRQAVVRAFKDGPTLSLGVANARNSEGDEGLMRQEADSALYEAKLKGRNATVLFAGAEDTRPVFPAAKIAGLRKLLAEGSVEAVFQPIWNLTDGTLLGHEALSRFPEEYDLPGPLLAFDIAERIGRSDDLDRLCRAATLRRAGSVPSGGLLFVNISPYTLTHAEFSADALAKEFQAAGLEPERVVLEITGRRTTVSLQIIASAVDELRTRGFKVALDDVGARNTGLEMLRRVSADYVKIDNDALLNALKDTMGRASVMAIVAFAAQSGALVVAEGVEDEATMDLVRWISGGGGDSTSMVYAVQGFLLGLPSSEMSDALPPTERAA